MYFLCYCQNADNTLKELPKNERQGIVKKLQELTYYTPEDIKSKYRYLGENLYLVETGNAAIIIEQQNRLNKNILFVREIYFGKKVDAFHKRHYIELKTGTWIKKHPLSDNDIKKCEAQIKQEQIKRKTPPPQQLIKWINEEFELSLDFNIFEFPDWVNYTLNDTADAGLNVSDIKLFGQILNEIANDRIEKKNNFLINEKLQIFEYQQYNLAIFYKHYKINAREIIILFGGANLNTQKNYYQKLKHKFSANDFGQKINFNSIDDISKQASRAYPIWTVKNAQNIDYLWFAIEKNSELDNLALLSEQIDLLNNIREQLPIYIYGQAGSGKSTILYYVFANLYYLSIMNDILHNKMIFLSENKNLLERTKQIVRSLLLNNPKWALKTDDLQELDIYFKTFRDFILEIIPEKYKNNFPEEKYLNFPKFKELYLANHSLYKVRNEISPEEAWFTITTFIYGYDLENIYLSNDYEKIIKKLRKHIPKERYKKVEQEILPFYEKLVNEEGYWDKLQAIRFINERVGFSPKYLAIICDEAQDFSRAEIMFIIRQLELSKYNLADITNLPIIFAGDQNQTVNPTGYRDDDIQTIIRNELETLNFNGDLNAFESEYNYRSIKQIVYLADIIQYYRNKVLSLKIEKPQLPKRQEDIKSNIFFSYDFLKSKPALKEDIKKRVKYKMFIIPADLFEKNEYINKNELLNELADSNDLIRTAVETKGIDYKQVVIYGFGEYFLKNFSDTLELKNTDENIAFIYKYFFNKLYVAITRAQNELLIIDSEEAWKKFWQYLINQDFTDEKWAFLNNEKNNLISKDIENSITLIKESKKENALEVATAEKDLGIMEQNPTRLKVAASLFATYGENTEANYCLALAQEYQGNFLEAIKYYEKIGQLDKISEIAFNIQEFEKLFSLDITLIENKTAHQIRSLLAKAIKQDDFYTSEIRKLNEHSKILISILKKIDWYQDIILLLINSTKKKDNNWHKKTALQILWEIAQNIKLNDKLVQEIAQLAVDIDHSITAKILELYNLQNNILYYKAKLREAHEKQEPENIIFWNFKLLLDFDKNENYLKEISKIFSQYSDTIQKDNFILLAANLTYLLTNFTRDKTDQLLQTIQTIENTDQPHSIYNTTLEVIMHFSPNKLLTTFIIERWAKYTYQQSKDIKPINEFYSQISNTLNLDYQEFNEKELKKLEPVKSVPINYPSHVRNLKIENFRQFNLLELQDIGQFNLIVGDNNAGKTSLLEALLINSDTEKTIQYLKYAFWRRNGIEATENIHLQEFFRTDTNEIILTNKEKRYNWQIRVTLNQIKNIDFSQKTNDIVPFIPFGRENLRRIAKFYEQEIFIHTRKRREFQDMLKIFIPDLVLISADTNGDILVETKNSEQALPLSYFGEGAYKMFHTLIYLYYFKNQRIMIDEVDAGIYYAHFKEFWKALLKLADKTNTQIFATTHNKECIEIFLQVLKDDEFASFRDRSRVITLYKFDPDKFKAYTHNYEQFSFLIDNEYEIRGELL